jgi:lipopolysaccharide/colanic/teichoic acid biosynthesis glycosyltransferase
MFEDPRVTRVGKMLRATSIDELPQLLNVLLGQMSLVGPRPLVEEELRFSPAWRRTRLRVKPGITGLWQVSGRSNSGFHDWITRDTEYVRTQSLLLDLKILLATVAVVLRQEGTH